MEYWQLRQRQSLWLDAKVALSQRAIRAWYDYWDGNVYVSFSGGKDSCVLLHMVRSMYPEVPAVFLNTGLEYPEVTKLVSQTENVITIRPKMTFRQVLEEYGYPVVSKEQSQFLFQTRTGFSEKLKRIRLYGNKYGRGKISEKWKFLLDAPFKISHKCCLALKKRPAQKFERESGLKPFVGSMAAESALRRTAYLRSACNAFDASRPISMPMGFWLEDDVWEYLHRFNVPYSKIYDMGYNRTGCMFCMYGVHKEPEPNKFQRMKLTHPKLYQYCIYQLGIKDVLEYIGVPWQ